MSEVSPEDLEKYEGDAKKLLGTLNPGETMRWADAVNTAASMGEIDNEEGGTSR